MRKVFVCSIVLMVLTLNVISAFDKEVKGNGNVTKVQRDIKSFNEIGADGIFKIYLMQGNKESVEVEIDENLQEYVIIKNNGHKLELSFAKGINVKKTTENNVYITFKDLKELDIDGVCNVESKTTLKCNDLKLDIDGVATIKLELDCGQVKTDLDGVGNVELYGKADKLTIKKTGVGSLNSKKLDTKILDINNSGVGNADVYASKEISLNNSGVGSITYSGDAAVKALKSDGVGKIKKGN